MKIRAIKIDKRFVPEWNDNKSLPVNEQLVIHFKRIPGTSEKSVYISVSFDTQAKMQLSYNDNLLIQSFVDRVENLEIEIDGKDKKIMNGRDLATANASQIADLLTEIRNYLFPESDELTPGEKKA